MPVVVVGAGLTGMSAAFHLRRAGVPYRLLERSLRPGGLAVTDEEAGFRFDRTGHLLHGTDTPEGALALEWMGPDRERVVRNAAIWSHGGYTPYPFQANLRGLPAQVSYECLLGFVRAWAARMHAGVAVEAPRTFRDFCDQVFGDGISRHFMVPYNTRMWGVPPEEITAAWCSRFVPVPELEDVVAGMTALADRKLGYNAEFVYPTSGIGQLSDGLASRLGALELGRRVDSVDAAAKRLTVDDETIGYEVLVSSAPLPELVAMMVDVPHDVLDAASKLRCTHLWYLDLALGHPCPLPYHWVYVPEPRFPFYRVGCYSNFSPAMAPPGSSNLYVELASRERPELARLLPEVLAALVKMGFVRGADALRFARLRRIDHAYVIFDHDFAESLEAVQRYLDGHQVLSVGRYGAWNYSSMTDAIRFGREAAERAQAWLGQ